MRRFLPSLLIWLAAVAAATLLWRETRGPREPFPGLVGLPATTVASVEPGRLAALSVEVGDAVAAGAPIASLEPAGVDGEIEVARAELAVALAEVEAAARTREEARSQRALTVLSRKAEAEAALGAARGRPAAARAELRALSSSLRKMQPAVSQGLARGDRLTDLEARSARLTRESRQANSINAWASFSTRLESLLQEDEAGDDPVVGSARQRVELMRRKVDALVARRGRLGLKAPAAGRVSRIVSRPGAALAAGQAVVEIVEADTRLVLAWVPEARSRHVEKGSKVVVRAMDRRQETLTGSVERVGPALEALPIRLWADRNTPKYGRPIHVRVEATGLLVGEAVQVALR